MLYVHQTENDELKNNLRVREMGIVNMLTLPTVLQSICIGI